jgi:membrane protein
MEGKVLDQALPGIITPSWRGDMSRKVLAMFVVALRDFTRNNCPYVAAGIAYWTLFSIFPLVLAGIAILGFLYVSPEEQSEVVEGVLGLVPVSADYLTSLIEEVSRARGTLGVLAVVGLLWGGTAVFSAVRKGINHSWHIGQPHNFVLERAIDSIMLLGVTLLAFILAVFTTNVIGFSTFAATPEWLGGNVIGKVLLEIVALVTTCGVLAALYRYVPNTRVEWEMYGLVRSWEGLCFMESGSASHGSCPTLAISTCYMVPWVRSWRCWSGPTSPHWP